jgi:hypothetical protein
VTKAERRILAMLAATPRGLTRDFLMAAGCTSAILEWLLRTGMVSTHTVKMARPKGLAVPAPRGSRCAGTAPRPKAATH